MSRFAILATGAAAVHLTPDNWDEMTAGKTVFLKMYAPWCGHCKSMAPAWDTLTAEYADSDTALVAEIDCTAEGKPLCDANGVKGFPSLKHGDPNGLEDYEGGRTLEDFQKFASENLKPKCGVNNLDLCDDETKARIAELQELSEELLDEQIKTKEDEIAAAEKEFADLVTKLQKKYEKTNKKKDKKIKDIKDSGLGLMKAIRAMTAAPIKTEL